MRTSKWHEVGRGNERAEGDTGADVSTHGETCVHRKGRQAGADRGGEGSRP